MTSESRHAPVDATGGNIHHNRGLDRFDALMESAGLSTLTARIAARLTSASKVRLLEIGCGEGHLLLDLLARFGEAIELHGVNAVDWPVISADDDLRETNARYQITSEGALAKTRRLPRVHLMDAQDMKSFRAGTFDFVISQVSLPHIPRKDRVLEESARILARDGVFVHELDQLSTAEVDLSGADLPRFVIRRGSTPLSTTACLQKKVVRIHRARRTALPASILAVYEKTSMKSLRLGLDFDAQSTVVLTDVPHAPGTPALWGVRSVYRS